MVGYTEETMFRGILFFGSTERFTLLWGAIISAIIFGLFHYLNMIGGQGFGITTSQVVHAFSVGFMYASLRLMTGSLWPVMLLHALWDFSILSMQSAMLTAGGEVGAGLASAQVGGVSISPIQVLPGLLYGAFVFWRWTVRSKKRNCLKIM
jgi:membrane protease YdiL (CAAX protease family)